MMSLTPAIDASQPFARIVIDELKELVDSGFVVTEAGPTIVKLIRDSMAVDVYWGRKSYEVGAGITFDGERYALSELIYLVNPQLADDYRNPTATSVDLLSPAVTRVTHLLKTYGSPAFVDAEGFESRLREQRPLRVHEFALDSLARITRPAAEEAFRRHDFAKAAELYLKIEERLSEAELKKLAYAKSRSAPKH